MRSRAALEHARVLRPSMRGLQSMIEARRASQLDGQSPAALLSTICNTIAKRFEASCSGGCRPRCGSRCQDFGRARPCRALRRPPRPLAPLRCAPVSFQVLKCALVVLVQCNENVCWSVHRGRARACARARVCVCAAQGLPDEPTRAGNGPPVPELCNHRTWPRARGHPPWWAVHRKFLLRTAVIRLSLRLIYCTAVSD